LISCLGQQVVAEEAMDIAAKEGHWVVLQNIHLGLI
jgi:dynein heavy chain